MIEAHPISLDINQDAREKIVDVEKTKPLRLSGQQQALYNALLEKDLGLTNMYYGALMVLDYNSNPDNLALAAHGLRELMEKIPVFVDVQIRAQTESLKGKVLELESFWTATLRKTKCYKSQKWSGQIDVPLFRMLERFYIFFEWFIKHHPRRRAEIIATLQGLDNSRSKLPEHLEKLNAQSWDDMRDFFQAVSHHRKSTTTEEFSQRLNMLEKFLLDRLHPRTFADINVIDEIIREGESDAKLEVIKKALREIRKRGVNYEYFFNELKSSDWIEPLLNEGMFQHSPPSKQEGDYISFPFWPESRYLARMAPLAPELVLKVALKIPETENFRVHADLADAACAMPPKFAAAWAKREAIWVKSHQYLYLPLPEKLGKLISYLACAGRVKEAIDMTCTLLAVLPDSRTKEKFEEDEIYLSSPEPRTRFDIWHYEQILKKQIPDLVAVAGESALGLLSDLLSDAIRFSRRHKEDEGPEDYSYVWRPAIEDHNQNHPYGLKDLLVLAVRDAAEALIETKGKVILEIIEEKPFKIFQRIGLHLRRKWPNVDPEGTASLLSDPNVFNDIHLHHELYHLLNEQFNNLPQKIQQAYLSMIDKGIDAEQWLDFRDRERGHRPSQQEGERYERRWQYTKLWPIQVFLKLEWQQRFNALKKEFGELDHPDFHVYASTGWVGPTSPKGIQELRSMKIDELITFLKTWKPSGDIMSPSPQGIGRELTNLITSDPAYFAVEAIRFEGLDPTYVHALLSGFRTAKREGNFPWTPVFDLCRWVIDQPRENIGHKDEDIDSDPDWIWTRRAIANLLSDALEPGAAEISFDHRAAVWDVLRPLTDDPDPTPEHEERYGGSNMDPATLSINTVRGEAMHAVVRYALWVRRHLEKAAIGKKRISSGFDEMPEVREVLDHHLDTKYDQALAIRAIYGQWFPWLVQLDGTWTAQKIVKIFPLEDALSILRDAAWEAYIAFCAPYDNVFDLLHEEYAHAVERIGTISSDKRHLADPDVRLAEHLMTYYWRGKLNLNEPGGLLARFYAKADGMLRSRSLEFIGRSLQNTKETVAPHILERLQALWAQRIEEVRNSAPPAPHTELAAFGWWFISAKFDDGWSIAQLRDVLKLTGSIEPDFLVIERLAALASSMPVLTVECLGFMVKGEKEGWGIHSWSENVRKILVTALHSEDIVAHQTAEDIVDLLIARGYLAFRDLLSEMK